MADQMTFQEKLNIPTVSISKAKNQIKTYIKNYLNLKKLGIDVEKQTFHLIGQAGIGKTQVCYQVADELTQETDKKFDIKRITCPFLSRDDFIIPFPTMKDDDPSFRMLYSDFVPKDKDSYGIFVIDEFARGDKQLQQLLWQVQNECKMHMYEFPENWFVVSLDNPDEAAYDMDYMEDAAGLRRMLHMYVETSATDFISHAISRNFHPLVVQFIQTHPDYLYDFDAQKAGRVYANPASYEKVSNILWGFEKDSGVFKNLNNIELFVGGLLNIAKTNLFMDFLKDIKVIKPHDIFEDYEKVRKEIQKFNHDGDNAKLGEIMVSFAIYLITDMPQFTQKNLNNIESFLLDCPVDTTVLFYNEIYKLDRSDNKVNPSYEYMTKLNTGMRKSPRYKELHNILLSISANGSRKPTK